MGWESRRGGLFYYRKKRIGNKVVSEYVGRGEIARLVSQFEELEAEERTVARMLAQHERDKVREVEDVLKEQERSAKALLAQALVSAGYHDHRGQWRKKRLGSDEAGG